MTILNTSTSALLAFQRALDTISHNVANANTEGYSRQRAELVSIPGTSGSGGFIGNGVNNISVTRNADDFLQARRLDSLSELGRLDSLATLSTRMDSALTSADTGIGKPWSGFFDAIQGVATQPSSTATRQALINTGQTLVNRFHTLNTQIEGLYSETNGRISSSVADVNQLSASIAKLNKAIQQQSAADGRPPNDLLDQRDLAASQLAKIIGASTVVEPNGYMNVFTTSGQALVVGETSMSLTTMNDPYQPTRIEVGILSNGVTSRLDTSQFSGELGGVMDFRRNVLEPAAVDLGKIATGLVSAFNAQHRAGIDLNGAMGGDFFTPLTPSARPNSSNTGSATLNTSVGDAKAISGDDVVLSFDGSSWSAVGRRSGALIPITGSGTVASPLRVDGIDVVVSGSAAAGDKFLLQSVSEAAANIKVAISDPTKVAAASPVAATANLNNQGSGKINSLTVTNSADPALTNAVSINFLSATTYSLNGGPAQAYNATTGIVANGWTLKLDGSPRTGDTFSVGARGAGSSDNSNMRLLTQMTSTGFLDGSSISLDSAISQLTIQTGMAARQATASFDAQKAVQTQLDSEQASVSGVNLDEEAANLMQYQQAYQAAAKMVATADSLFQTLLEAVRR